MVRAICRAKLIEEKRTDDQRRRGNVENASGEGEQERWFGEKGRHESSEMEHGS